MNVIVCGAFVIIPVRPVGWVNVYLEACVPLIVLVDVTEILLPALAEANVPVPLKVTTSEPTMPLSVPVIVAVVVPS